MAVKVGMGVIIVKNGKVLLGKRKGSHGEGKWCAPGGHLEVGETWEECAKRETLEEVGIKINNVRFAAATNDIFNSEKHYVTIYVTAEQESGEVSLMEPDKCEKWEWFSWDNLPEPMFLSWVNLLKQGYNPF
jgi:8-oxo-dGTP diphosphatase